MEDEVGDQGLWSRRYGSGPLCSEKDSGKGMSAFV